MSEPLELAEEWIRQVWQRGKTESVTQLCAEDYTDYTLPESEDGDVIQFQDFARELHVAFPNLEVELADSFQDVDYAILRMVWHGAHRADYMEFAPTQKTIEWESIEILHFHHNQLIERWAQNDLLKQLQQTSAAPASETDFGVLQRESERADLIARLADIPAQLRAVIRAQGVRPASTEAWSTAAAVGNLWHTEREVWQARLQALAREENPSWDARASDRFAREEEFGAADVNVLLDAFEFLRNATCDYLRGLAEEDWARGFGNVDVASLMTEAVLHDQENLAQLSGAQL